MNEDDFGTELKIVLKVICRDKRLPLIAHHLTCSPTSRNTFVKKQFSVFIVIKLYTFERRNYNVKSHEAVFI